MTASGSLDFRILRGLSLSVFGSASRIRDQIFLSGADLSVEDQLVRRRQLATNFFYSSGIGLTFRFGSIGATLAGLMADKPLIVSDLRD